MKKILIITQKVDSEDSILGFFHRWIEEFAKNYDKVTVICLGKGKYNLPENVSVFSLGKESGVSKFTYLFRFYKYICTEHKNYDVVFVHMNPIYVVLGGLFWKILDKKVSLWYTHKHVDLKLRIAVWFSDVVFSASKESFRLKTNKLIVTGHGIDTDLFKKNKIQNARKSKVILTLSRISKTKNIDKIIKSFEIVLEKSHEPVELWIGGKPLTKEDEEYEKQIKKSVSDKVKKNIVWLGAIPNNEVVKLYDNAELCVNLSDTGSLDKFVLEAMSCSVPVVTSNVAFSKILPKEMFVTNDVNAVANSCLLLLSNKNVADLRNIIVEGHSLPKLIEKIISHT